MGEALSSWLPGFNRTCPDPGLRAYSQLDESHKFPARVIMWIGMLIACEQVTHAIALLLTSRRAIRLRSSFSPFRLSVGVALAWAVFTSLSIFLVGFTFRSNAAILVKSLHVATETIFLIMILVSFGFTVLASLAALLVLIILPMTLTLPCSETILMAASSGLVLDALNFLVYAWYGVTNPNDPVLWLYIAGLGWHAMYLVTFLGVMRWENLDGLGRVYFRIAGMYFNLVAVEFFLAAIRACLLVTASGRQNLKDWLNEFDSDLLRQPLCVWTGQGLRLLGPVGQSTQVNAFEPNRTAYTPRGFVRACNALFILLGQLKLDTTGDVTTVRHSLACAYGYIKPYTIERINDVRVEHAYVVSWMQIRVAFWAPLAAVACVLGYYP